MSHGKLYMCPEIKINPSLLASNSPLTEVTWKNRTSREQVKYRALLRYRMSVLIEIYLRASLLAIGCIMYENSLWIRNERRAIHQPRVTEISLNVLSKSEFFDRSVSWKYTRIIPLIESSWRGEIASIKSF